MPFATLNSSAFAHNGGSGFYPIIDGDFLKNGPVYQFKNGKLAPIDIIIGCNSDEGLSVGAVYFDVASNTSEQVAAVIEGYMGINSTGAQELLDLYPEGEPSPPYSQPMNIDWIGAMNAIGHNAGPQSRRLYAILGDFQVSDPQTYFPDSRAASILMTCSSSQDVEKQLSFGTKQLATKPIHSASTPTLHDSLLYGRPVLAQASPGTVQTSATGFAYLINPQRPTPSSLTSHRCRM